MIDKIRYIIPTFSRHGGLPYSGFEIILQRSKIQYYPFPKGSESRIKGYFFFQNVTNPPNLVPQDLPTCPAVSAIFHYTRVYLFGVHPSHISRISKDDDDGEEHSLVGVLCERQRIGPYFAEEALPSDQGAGEGLGSSKFMSPYRRPMAIFGRRLKSRFDDPKTPSPDSYYGNISTSQNTLERHTRLHNTWA